MSERRRDKRYPLDTPITMKLGKKAFPGKTVNVCFKGLLVQAEEGPNVRQLVRIDLELPGGVAFTANTMVVRAEGGMVGLEFFGKTANEWDEAIHALARTAGPSMPSGPVPPHPMGSAPPPNPMTTPSAGYPAPPRPITAPGGHIAPPRPPSPGTAPMTPPSGVRVPIDAPMMGSRTGQPPYTGPERRRAPRIGLKLEIRLRTPRAIHTAQTIDVSMLSASVLVSEAQVVMGEPVIVNLIQPGTNFSFRRDGTIRRVTPVDGQWIHLGLELAGLEPMREILFADFMNSAYATLNAGR